MKHAKIIWICIVAIALLSIVPISIFRMTVGYRSITKAIEDFDFADVSQVLVYEGDWPKGNPRIVEDMGKIGLLIESLKTGEKYFPNHDKHNGFERVVIVQPQNLEFRVYQRTGDDHSVIIHLGESTSDSSWRSFGHMRCPLSSAWTEL